MAHKIAYYQVERQIDFYFVQKREESTEYLHATPEGIFCNRRRYSWEQLHDISYKPFSSGEGLLYLHTFQGMFSYRVKDNPQHFVNYVKEQVERN